MSTPEPPSSPEVAPVPDDDQQPCPCCYKLLGVRQIQRHLDIARERELAGVGMDASSDDSDLADDEMDLANEAGNDLAEDAAGVEDGNLEVLATRPEVVQHDMEMDLGDGILEQQGAEVNPDNAGANGPPEPMHGLRRNPPVRIEVWPDIDANFDLGPGSEDEDEPIDDPDRDPEFEERDEAPAFDPIDEPRFTHEEVRELLNQNLGDLADEQWIDMYARVISKGDQDTLSMLATRLRTHFSRSTWDDLRHGVCKDLEIPSEFIAWRRLRILSGKYKNLDMCPYCDEPRYNSRGTARRVFHYTPLIPQLRGLFQNREMAAKLRYRAEVEETYDPDVIEDVFDGEHYRSLRGTKLHPDSDYHIFDNPEDIALGISTDGFTLFKRRRRGLSTAWPIILVNYNLHPRVRTRLQNVICVGVIPGPKQCKDLNSFLIPLLEELLALEDGVETTGINPQGEGINFLLRAFIILGFGDIPAVAKLLLIKAHNALTPCRTCYVQGVLCQLERNAVYYLPLTHPDTMRTLLIDEIPMRTHQDTLARLTYLDGLETRAEREQASREYGLTGRSIFTHLKSIDLASCFPYDLMHLIFENLVPNMIRHWTGEFKGLDEGNGAYRIPPSEWEAIGILTAQATKTIPASFVGTLPNICTDRNLYKAEAYSFWIQYLAPILLKDRLPEPYYSHLLLLREIVLYCLKFSITREEVDELEQMVNQWVLEYEE